MEIERINENTVKFFISYVDVEERGFDREEIWYNREKSEELFWEMMDEVHEEEEDFTFDGPLWIQVQALEKGLEVLVTKAQLTKDGAKYEFPFPDDKLKELSAGERFEELLDHHFHYKDDNDNEAEEDSLSFVAYFKDFEDVLMLSKSRMPENMLTKLYSIENHYYLYVEFPFEDFTEEDIDDSISIILEYAMESQRTIHYLSEYGKLIIDGEVFTVLNKHFR